MSLILLLIARDLNTAPHEVTNAKGNYIHLDNGQAIFDATGGAAVACTSYPTSQPITLTEGLLL